MKKLITAVVKKANEMVDRMNAPQLPEDEAYLHKVWLGMDTATTPHMLVFVDNIPYARRITAEAESFALGERLPF